MIEVADVFRRFAGGYLSDHGARMLPSHRRTITDIIACRTEALGGHLWRCDHCSAEIYSYHSCRNRSCPKCHGNDIERWLARRRSEMLPTHYFHVTVTVPEELRAILRANQRDGYGLLMKASAEAIVELARDERYVGATVGVMAVLHTWTQQLIFHPHVHCLVTGGGVSDLAADGTADWHPAKKNFLVPVRALAKLVRGKLMHHLRERCPDLVLPAAVWRKPWVVHCTPWGQGEQAVLDYLARYVFRVAITSSRIEALDDRMVTIRYTDRKNSQSRSCQIKGDEFLRRFLTHVLPGGFHKVRYYGLWHHTKRPLVERARLCLALDQHPPAGVASVAEPPPHQKPTGADTAPAASEHAAVRRPGAQNEATPHPPEPLLCPKCRCGHLLLVRRLPPQRNAMGP